MERRPIGRTGMTTGVVGLGTMTWGRRNSAEEAHAQIDFAVDAGVDLLDAAEMYPFPSGEDAWGRTEEIIGAWLRVDKTRRDKVLLATKAVGRTDRFPFLRGGGARLDRANITAALDDSLRRLGVETIDLYQLHWPDRATNFFGALGYAHRDDDPEATPLAETLGVLNDCVAAGKIRAVGLSNETPWGVAECLRLADRLGLPRVATIQNPYSLLNRTFEIGLAEFAMREDVGLLAYSPLGFGVLSGKYLDGTPDGSRLAEHPTFKRYVKPQGVAATARYVAIARDAGLDPAQMALAYVNSRPFTTANLIGATSMAQLESNIASAALRLPDDVVEAIEAAHAEIPNPAP